MTAPLDEKAVEVVAWQQHPGGDRQNLIRESDAAARMASLAAQVLRLTEENEALRKERTSLIETKREQIDRLMADRDHNASEYEKVLNSYADENQCFSDQLEAAEARIKALEEADGPDEHGFVVGEPVEKFTGEARWEGILVSAYRTTSGQRRYVVEVKPQGFQMIAVPSQLRMIATLQKEQRQERK